MCPACFVSRALTLANGPETLFFIVQEKKGGGGSNRKGNKLPSHTCASTRLSKVLSDGINVQLRGKLTGGTKEEVEDKNGWFGVQPRF